MEAGLGTGRRAIVRHGVLLIGVVALAACSPVCGSRAPTPAPSAQPSSSTAAKAPEPDVSCQKESSSHSLNSNTATSFTFTNQTSETLTLFWLNFQGKRVSYGNVASGATQQQGTFVTHPWVVADPHGTCLLLFLVTAPAHITIR